MAGLLTTLIVSWLYTVIATSAGTGVGVTTSRSGRMPPVSSRERSGGPKVPDCSTTTRPSFRTCGGLSRSAAVP